MSGRAAIVCGHVARGAPILLAVRDYAIDDADSGWQFLCDRADEDPQSAEVWSVAHVVEIEPTLQAWVKLKAPIALARRGLDSPWQMIRI